MRYKGFVLIELLVALAILSIVFFYLIPNVGGIFSKANSNKNVEILNTLVEKAYKKAQQTGIPQEIWGLKGSTNIHFSKKLYYLSSEVLDVKVNGKYQKGDKYIFLVYPDGIMDNVKLNFMKTKIVSLPLLLEFKVE